MNTKCHTWSVNVDNAFIKCTSEFQQKFLISALKELVKKIDPRGCIPEFDRTIRWQNFPFDDTISVNELKPIVRSYSGDKNIRIIYCLMVNRELLRNDEKIPTRVYNAEIVIIAMGDKASILSHKSEWKGFVK